LWLAQALRGSLAHRADRCDSPQNGGEVSRAKGLVATSQGLMVVGKANPDEEVLRAIVDSAFTGLS